MDFQFAPGVSNSKRQAVKQLYDNIEDFVSRQMPHHEHGSYGLYMHENGIGAKIFLKHDYTSPIDEFFKLIDLNAATTYFPIVFAFAKITIEQSYIVDMGDPKFEDKMNFGDGSRYYVMFMEHLERKEFDINDDDEIDSVQMELENVLEKLDELGINANNDTFFVPHPSYLSDYSDNDISHYCHNFVVTPKGIRIIDAARVEINE